MANKAVVLGANYYIGLSIIRCLGIQNIPVVAIDYSWEGSYGLHSKYCSEKLIAPHYKKDPQGFLDFLVTYGKKQSEPPVLFPSADPYVGFIDDYLSILKEYYFIPQTQQGLYTKVMDKERLEVLAREHDLLVPETLRLNDSNFIQKLEDDIHFPCLIKPTDSPAFVSKFRKKLFKVHNMDELNSAIDKAQKANLEVIVQRIIPGFDNHMYTFDAYLNQEGKVTHWTTCQKYRQYPINFGASVYTRQKYVPELYDIGANFLENIRFKGFAEIEFKKDSQNGQFYLIEINVRTTNFNSMLYKIGLNMPYIAYKDLIGTPLEPIAFTKNSNVFFWYAYEDLLAVRDYIKTGQLTLSQVLKTYFNPKAYAIWDWKDPQPGFIFLKGLLGRVWNKFFKKSSK